MPGKPAHNERTVSTYCYQCVAGPDLLKVRVEDGIGVACRGLCERRGTACEQGESSNGRKNAHPGTIKAAPPLRKSAQPLGLRERQGGAGGISRNRCPVRRGGRGADYTPRPFAGLATGAGRRARRVAAGGS